MKSYRPAALEMATTGWVVTRATAGEFPFEPTDISLFDTTAVERVRAASERKEVAGMLAIVVGVAAMWGATLGLAALIG
jgi:hypothetical protein